MARPKNEESNEDFELYNEDEDYDWDEDDEEEFEDDEETDEDEDDSDDEVDEDDEDDSEEDLVERVKKATVQEIVNAIASGDSDNEVYKGLQRVIDRKDKEIARLEQALSNKFEHDDEAAEERDEVLQFLLQEFIELSGDEAETKLGKLKTSLQDKRIKRLQQRNNRPQQQQQTANTDEDDNIRIYKEQAERALREYAEDMGVDPSDKRLDYGAFEDGVIGRMNKLKASIKKITEEKEVTTRPKKKKIATRTAGGSLPNKATGGNRGNSRFDKGVSDLFDRYMKATKGR